MDGLVRDAEAFVTDRMVDGTIEHPRLRATLVEIDNGAYAAQIAMVRRALDGDPEQPLKDALLAALTRMVGEAGVPVAMVQIVAMAFYRSTWQLLRRIDPEITLDRIRATASWRALAMMDGFVFGRHGRMPIDAAVLRACVERLKRTLVPPVAADGWSGSPLPEGPSIVTADASEGPGTAALRNAVFRAFFCEHLLSEAAAGHALVIDVLEEAVARPERMPFLRGADAPQRAFRIAQLARTLVVLHDLACRLARHRERIPAELAEAPITVQAAALAKQGIGATAGFDHLLVECLYADWDSLTAWVRGIGPRLRIPRVVSGAPAPAKPPTTRTPAAVRPAAPPSTSFSRPAISPALGLSPFGWQEEAPAQPGTALQRKPAAPPARPLAKPPTGRTPRPDPPDAFDRGDTERLHRPL